jgi:hypothetical protein
MERKTRNIDQNKDKQDPINFVRDNALVKEEGSKPSLSSKGEQVLRGLQSSLAQPDADSEEAAGVA